MSSTPLGVNGLELEIEIGLGYTPLCIMYTTITLDIQGLHVGEG